jgi:hypothetical protein
MRFRLAKHAPIKLTRPGEFVFVLIDASIGDCVLTVIRLIHFNQTLAGFGKAS